MNCLIREVKKAKLLSGSVVELAKVLDVITRENIDLFNDPIRLLAAFQK